jgi:N-methylhydantoinase B/oxoprolinase/acetone carboxylase alpha subunit
MAVAAPVDPVTFEIIRHKLYSVMDETIIALENVSGSPSPYRGGTHNQDVRLIRPLFLDGEIFAYAAACGHWSDMGGPIPGTFNPSATEAWAEGIVIPPTRLYHCDRPVKSTFEFIRMNVRVPHERMGDAAAQYQATKLLERRLSEYVERYGKETVQQAFEAVMDYSERLFRQELAELPDGVYVFNDFCDHDIGRADHPRVKFTCRLTVDGDQATVDWTESDDAPVGPRASRCRRSRARPTTGHSTASRTSFRSTTGSSARSRSRRDPGRRRTSSIRRRWPATAPPATRSATPR